MKTDAPSLEALVETGILPGTVFTRGGLLELTRELPIRGSIDGGLTL